MAKIDVALINGYADMSAEDKVKALEAFEYNDNSAELENLKNLNTKANSEAKSWKDKYNSTLSEAEKKANEEKDRFEQMETELNALRKEKLISEHTAEYVGLGYSKELAADTAAALAEGNMTKVFANQKAFQEIHDKAYKAQLLGETPPPAGGNGGTAITKEKLRSMSPQERYEFSQSNPDAYKEIYKGE